MGGRSRGEKIGVLQLPQHPTAKPVTQEEIAHSVCMLEGLTSIKKGYVGATRTTADVWISRFKEFIAMYTVRKAGYLVQ